MHALKTDSYEGVWLLCVASALEARAVAGGVATSDVSEEIAASESGDWRAIALDHRLHFVVTGVGKANAAAAVARVYDAERYAGVCVLGIGGALPVEGAPAIGDLVVATRSVYADEGVETPTGFEDVAAMGFGPSSCIEGVGVECDLGALDLGALGAHALGVVATVSTCSGTDARAQSVIERTGAVVEAMEGAAAAFCAKRLSPDRPVVELRVVSNTTGDRTAQRWDIEGALTRLGSVARSL